MALTYPHTAATCGRLLPNIAQMESPLFPSPPPPPPPGIHSVGIETKYYDSVQDALEFLLENILNMVGFFVGLAIGIMCLVGFRNTGSPTLFRLTIAFFAISAGFCIIWIGYLVEDLVTHSGSIERWVQTFGIAVQTIGYFFIAFSHSIKAFIPKSSYFRSVGVMPLFLISSVQIEHIFRSVSFILLAYGAIETMLSYMETKNRGAISVTAGLALLAFGEFLGWYSFVFPESILYPASVAIKIAGLVALFIPVSKVPLTRIKIDDGLDEGESVLREVKGDSGSDVDGDADKPAK